MSVKEENTFSSTFKNSFQEIKLPEVIRDSELQHRVKCQMEKWEIKPFREAHTFLTALRRLSYYKHWINKGRYNYFHFTFVKLLKST